MAILVTGGAGYVGSHACLELLNAGYELVVIDNLSNSNRESLNRIQMLTGKPMKYYNVDLLNKESIDEIFSENNIDAVIHFAGLKAVGESVSLPLNYYHNNITGTLILCQVMQKYNVKRIVFSSSATVYSPILSGAITEDHLLGSSNPYGRTKLIIEELFRDIYDSDKGWSILILRYFNPVGSHASGLLGENPKGIPNNLMPIITNVGMGKIAQLKVYGNDYATHDGTGVRDYIHVVDLAIGHLKALNKAMLGTGVEVYNLGSGKGYSVLDVVQTFEKVSGVTIPYTIVKRRPGDVAVCFADITKAKRELGWVANKGIEEMCADSWRWQLNNPNGYE